jgi:ribosomal protein S18 acetylase RimI-like enzyme
MESRSSQFRHPLDNPVYASLTGPHAGYAERRGNVLRYPPDMSPFVGMPCEPGPADWASAAELAGPGGLVFAPAVYTPFPDDWEVLSRGDGVQMVAESLEPAEDPEAVRLGPDDVTEMLDLAGRTKPGPFLSRTIEFGTYLGIRRDGKLVAMAGERLRPPGFTEISAICTDEAWRGHGFASRLTRAVAVVIAKRGDTAFLHAVATNTAAVRLYEKMGFTVRRTTIFPRARTPLA